ncbi:MAG: hypothetical protein JWR35_2271 [Marmoricola sp.]|jgi:hypothetical protein|nr:hypothetical protein [Marmoricola sp.]
MTSFALISDTVIPASTLHTAFFGALAAFVAMNTVMYVALAIAKMLPKVDPADWIRRPNQRAETRSTHPEGRSEHRGRHSS